MEYRYYISSAELKQAGDAIRAHWGIESMHWILDVSRKMLVRFTAPLKTRDYTVKQTFSQLVPVTITLHDNTTFLALPGHQCQDTNHSPKNYVQNIAVNTEQIDY